MPGVWGGACTSSVCTACAGGAQGGDDVKTLMQVGHSKRGIKYYHKAIMQIVRSRCDEKTKRQALVSLREGCAIHDVTVSGCTFTDVLGKKKKGGK